MERLFLCAINSSLRGQRWQTDQALNIGSDAGADIYCPDPSVSPAHARMVLIQHTWFVFDRGSAAGTRVNGVRVKRHGHQLRRGDVIQCGALSLQVVGPEFIKTSRSTVRVQAVAQHSWEKALASLAGPPDPAHQQHPHLLTLFRTNYHLCQVQCPDELMQTILDDTVAVLHAQRGSIVLADESDHLDLRTTARSAKAPHFRKWYSRTLVRRCFRRGESLLCDDIGQDAAHSTRRQNMASIICALLRTPRKKLGVLHLDRGPADPPFSLDEFSLADAIAASISSGLETSQLLVEQRHLFLHTVTALARAVEIRDQYTGNHTQRVTDYAMLLAAELHLPANELGFIQVGTPLHDIGKIGIADAVLRKPGRLTPEELEHMKTHPQMGAALLESIPGLRPVLPIIRHHHERWDGCGYPDQLAHQDISRLARIVAVSDAFDAMTSDRPYRPAMSLSCAFHELEQQSGSHFDPECVRMFMCLRPRIERIVGGAPGQRSE